MQIHWVAITGRDCVYTSAHTLLPVRLAIHIQCAACRERGRGTCLASSPASRVSGSTKGWARAMVAALRTTLSDAPCTVL